MTKYQEEELKYRQKISILAEQGNQEETNKEVTNLKEWKENTLNPIKAIGENCINPLIKNFSLRVNIDPRFLNFDLMLKEVFDMQYTNGDKRYEALSEYGMLKNQLDTLKQNNQLQTESVKEINKKFKSLSRKLVLNPESHA